MITQDDLLAELAKELTIQPLLPSDVTTERLRLRAKCSVATARRLLEKKVQNGELVRVPCRDETGRTVTAYRVAAK